MINVSEEIFTLLARELRELYPGIKIMGENVSQPSSFPCVAIDETQNTASELDFGNREKYSAVTYRVQVFCNDNTAKRGKAREIFGVVCALMHELGFVRKTYTTTPDVYNATVYQITATFEAKIREDGMIFRR